MTSKKPAAIPADLEAVLASLKRHGTKKTRDGFARYGIHTDKAFGVSMGEIQALGKRLGRNHELAAALWDTGWYEARLLASYVGDPARITSREMDRWCRDFDNWGICDTVCFCLFDKTPYAWTKVAKWSGHRDEFVKRAAFALLASLALHDKRTGDQPFLESLRVIEGAATDERNFVKKGVSWALRSVGRRNTPLHAAALELSRRLAASPDPTARWVGKDALRELTSPSVIRRLAAKR